MNVRLGALCVFAALFFASSWAAPALPRSPGPAGIGIHIVSSGPDRLLIEWQAGPYRLRSSAAGDVVALDGAERGADGRPVAGVLVGVPTGAQLKVTARVLADDRIPMPEVHSLARRAPRPLSGDDLGQPGEWLELPPGGVGTPVPVAGVVESKGAVEVGPPAMLRHQRVVRVRLFPLQRGEAGGEWWLHRHLQVQLIFEGALIGGPPATPEAFEAPPDAFEEVYRSTLVNYEQARAWRIEDLPSLFPSPARPGCCAESWRRLGGRPADADAPAPAPLKIVVDRDGLYRLTATELMSAGLPVAAIDPATLRLSAQGSEVALRVVGGEDGRLDGGDALEFYGEMRRGPEMRTKYSDENAYWLTYGAGPGLRMVESEALPPDGMLPAARAFPEHLHFEENREWFSWAFVSLEARQTDDTWFWGHMSTPDSPVTGTYAITLPAPAAGPITAERTARLRGELVGGRAKVHGHHHVRVRLNGEPLPVADVEWSDRTLAHIDAALDQDRLMDGQNSVGLELLTDNLGPDDIYLNWLEVDYPRALDVRGDRLVFDTPEQAANVVLGPFSTPAVSLYDITDPARPQHLAAPLRPSGGAWSLALRTPPAQRRLLAMADDQALAPKTAAVYRAPDLTAGTNSADYIVIAHHSLLAEARRLADHRAAQGLRVRLIDVDDVYNQFGAGLFHPDAIHDFLAYAFAHWAPPAPAWVVLVGSGHWNFKGYNPAAYGPAPPVLMPPYLWFVDPWQGEVDATNRFVTVAGDDILPDLFIGRLPADTPAQLRAMIDKIVRYDEQAQGQDWQGRALFVADNVPDDTGDFHAESDAAAVLLPPPMTARKVYMAASDPAAFAATTRAITEGLAGGVLLSQFAGHAALDRWSHASVFTTALAETIGNGPNVPVNLSFTCLDGYFYYPNRVSIAQALLWNPNGGAVASWSPTGLGITSGHAVLNGSFLHSVFDADLSRLGPATTVAKADLYATGNDLDLVDTFTIFGDPYLNLAVWRPELVLLADGSASGVLGPGQAAHLELSVHNAGRRQARPVRLSLAVPPELEAAEAVGSTVPVTAAGAAAWLLPPLDAGATAVLSLRMTVRLDGLPAVPRPVVVVARVEPATAEAASAAAAAGHEARFTFVVRAAFGVYLPWLGAGSALGPRP